MLTEFPFCAKSDSPALHLLRRMAHLLDFEKGPWVAGGVIRRILTGDEHDEFDIDVFFHDEEQRHRVTPELREIERVWRNESYAARKEKPLEAFMDALSFANPFVCQKKDDRGLAFARDKTMPPMQLIAMRYYADADELLADIDFTICQMVTDGRTVRCPDRSLNDLHEKRLRIAPTSVVRQTVRIFRYFTYGFEPDESVMQAVMAAPSTTYYDPTASGFKSYDAILDRMAGMDMAQPMLLSRLSDVMIERDGKTGVAYLYGYPFPAPLAFVYISCSDMRQYIAWRLEGLWKEKGLPPIDITRHMVSPERFFDAYRQAYREEA